MDNHDEIPGTPQADYPGPTEEAEVTGGEAVAFDIARFLESVAYPATKEDILDYAEDQGVEEVVYEMLDQLPETTYNTSTDVSQALGENANEVT